MGNKIAMGVLPFPSVITPLNVFDRIFSNSESEVKNSSCYFEKLCYYRFLFLNTEFLLIVFYLTTMLMLKYICIISCKII